MLLHSSTLRAGRAAGVRGRRGVLALTASVTATYAVLVTVVALLARTDTVRPQPVSAFVGAALVAGLASGTAAVRATGRAAVLWHRLPEPARRPVLPAAAASAVLVAGGALLAGGSLAVHHEQARALTAGLDGGAGGTMLLLLGCLLYVPTAAVWGVSFCVGPGFAVGAGTSVGSRRVDPRRRPRAAAARGPAGRHRQRRPGGWRSPSRWARAWPPESSPTVRPAARRDATPAAPVVGAHGAAVDRRHRGPGRGGWSPPPSPGSPGSPPARPGRAGWPPPAPTGGRSARPPVWRSRPPLP